MASFAVFLNSVPGTPDGILLILNEHREAEEIAIELRRHGQDVGVRELRTGSRSRPPSLRQPPVEA